MFEKPLLLPAPRFLSLQEGELSLADEKLIVLDATNAGALRFTAVRLQEALSQLAGVAWELAAGTAAPHDETGILLSIVPGGVQHLEGYRTPAGTYRFPARYLREQPRGYWVQGAYMRLEESRRSRQSLELDSTFRMCKIKKALPGDISTEPRIIKQGEIRSVR